MELRYTAEKPARLSDVLKRNMKISTGLMNRLKWEQKILVNNHPEHTDFPVKPGDMICLLLDEPEPEYPPEHVPLSILYEDEYILAVDKNPGVLIHPSRNRMDGTLANAVVGYYRETEQKSAFHPVTRLDRDTYGVVLIAKNAHVHALLNEYHAAGKLQKTYEALVFGGPENENGQIDAPIDRMPLPSLLRCVSPNGKPSQTRYQVIRKFPDSSLLRLEPVTGRTHQLRIHCAYIGCPILGDPQYGSEESQAYSQTLHLSYQRLCAKKLEFLHPITGTPTVIQSEMKAEI